jgi:hypothetical protein
MGWIAFAAHVVLLGMAALVNQMMVVFILIVATMLLSWQVGAEKNGACIGSKLVIKKESKSRFESHKDVCIRLGLTTDEEGLFVSWGLMPGRKYEEWWSDYNAKKRAHGSGLLWGYRVPGANRNKFTKHKHSISSFRSVP